MDDNVVVMGDWREKNPEIVYQCLNCLHQQFFICEEGVIECAACSFRMKNPCWIDPEE